MLTSLTAPAFAKTWCIEDGNITVKAGDTGNDVTQKGETTYGDTDTIITNQNKDIASSNTVTIETNDKNDKVEVTLKDVNINVGSDSGSALTSKGDVTLTLKGDNHLTGGISDTGNYGRNGIASTGSLTITGGENGSLTAQGGSGADGGHGGHGIYSNGSLTISGGSTVTANGGNGGNVSGDGISSNGSVTISGGTVTANGGDGSSGGDGIRSGDIDLSGSLELTAKAGSPNGKALSQAGHELDLDTIKDKLGPGAKSPSPMLMARPSRSPSPALWSRKSLLPLLTAALHPVHTRLSPPRPDCHRQERRGHLLHQHPERQYPHRLRRTVHSLSPCFAVRAASAAG